MKVISDSHPCLRRNNLTRENMVQYNIKWSSFEAIQTVIYWHWLIGKCGLTTILLSYCIRLGNLYLVPPCTWSDCGCHISRHTNVTCRVLGCTYWSNLHHHLHLNLAHPNSISHTEMGFHRPNRTRRLCEKMVAFYTSAIHSNIILRRYIIVKCLKITSRSDTGR